MNDAPHYETAVLISMNDVCKITSLSRTAVLRLLEADRFPPKISLGTGRRFAFVKRDVQAWIESRVSGAKHSAWQDKLAA